MLVSLLFVASPALAQDAPTADPAPKVQYEKETVVDFLDPADVIGKTVKPSVEFVEVLKPPKSLSLLRLRKDFNQELAQSVSDVK